MLYLLIGHPGIKVGVHTPLGQSNKGKFALSLAVKALDLFTEYVSHSVAAVRFFCTILVDA